MQPIANTLEVADGKLWTHHGIDRRRSGQGRQFAELPRRPSPAGRIGVAIGDGAKRPADASGLDVSGRLSR
jgi:hypothetical protein